VLSFAIAAINRGEKAAMFIFDEELGLLFDRAKGLGMDMDALVEAGSLMIEQVDAAEMTPGEFSERVRGSVEKFGARTVVVDSLNGYQVAMPQEQALILHMHELLQYLNRQGASTFLTVAQHGLVGDMKSPVDVTYLATPLFSSAISRQLAAFAAPSRSSKSAPAPMRTRFTNIRSMAPGWRSASRSKTSKVCFAASLRSLVKRHLQLNRRSMTECRSEQALILAPLGRDAAVAASMLSEISIDTLSFVRSPNFAKPFRLALASLLQPRRRCGPPI
jgi:hypothetical protein